MGTVYLGLECPPRQCNSQEQQRLPELPLRHMAAQTSAVQPSDFTRHASRFRHQHYSRPTGWRWFAKPSTVTVQCCNVFYILFAHPPCVAQPETHAQYALCKTESGILTLCQVETLRTSKYRSFDSLGEAIEDMSFGMVDSMDTGVQILSIKRSQNSCISTARTRRLHIPEEASGV